MRWAGPLLLLAGCYGPQPQGGAPCAPSTAPQRCPSGLVCVTVAGEDRCELGAVADGGVGGDRDVDVDACTTCTPTDDDGDGVANAADNCPQVANATQHDEDADMIGDPCDPCPIAQDNTDDDGDGVGNICDPDNTTQDQIADFVSFGNGALPAGWTVQGNFTASGDDGIGVAAANQGALLVRQAPAGGGLAVSASVTMTAFTTSLAGVGVVDQHQPGTDMGIACQLVANGSGTNQELRVYDGTVIGSAAHALVANDTYTVRITRPTAGSQRCDATNPVAMFNTASTFMPANAEVGVRVRSATATYHWILVVRRP